MQQGNMLKLLALSAGTLSVAACGADAHELDARGQSLTAECAEKGAVPEGAWVCPDARTLECGAEAVLYVPANELCEGPLRVSNEGVFPVGTHTVDVQNEAGDSVCAAELTVVDSQPPVVTEHTLALWPPNHKFHTISVADCVSATDACQGDLTGEFIWGSSDEPVDDKGDGHHAPDILLGADCQTVQVRAERAGPKNGRVYHLGVRFVDAAGNATEGQCTIVVDHDQRGVEGADDGESYRVTFDGTDGGLVCDGVSDDPPPAGDGDGDGAGDGDGDGDGDTSEDGSAGDGDADGDDGVVIPG